LKRRLIAVLLIAMIATTLFSVQAAETTAGIDTPAINMKTNVVSITGNAGIANKKISLLVLNPEGTLEGMITDPSSLQHQRTIVTDQDGKFSYAFELMLDGVKDTGDYTIYIGNFGGTVSKTFYFTSPADRKEMIENIVSASVGDLTELLEDEGNIRALALDTFKPYTGIDKEKLAQRIHSKLQKANIDPDDENAAGELQSLLQEYSVVEAYNQQKKELCYANNGDFLYPEIVQLHQIDEKMDLSIYEAYTNLISEAGQAAIRNELLGKNMDNMDQLQELFIRQVILKGIAYPVKNGYEHVYAILTNKNLTAAGLTLPKTLTDEAARELASQVGGFDSITAMQAKINSLLQEQPGNNNGDKGSGSSGKSSGGFTAPAVVIPVVTPTPEPGSPSNKQFHDIDNVAWAAEAITELNKKGIIHGVADGAFAPDDYITREQFAKILCTALGINDRGDIAFTDVESDSWYRPYVEAAVKAGIIRGKNHNLFGTGEAITRQDISVMVYRAFTDWPQQKESKEFADNMSIADYAVDAVAALSSAGIINGFEDGTFRPLEKCSRAQAAKIMYEVLKIKEVTSK